MILVFAFVIAIIIVEYWVLFVEWDGKCPGCGPGCGRKGR